MKISYKYCAQASIAFSLALLSAVAYPVSQESHNISAITDELAALDKLHQKFSTRLHHELHKNNSFNLPAFKTIKPLSDNVKKYMSNNQPVIAANLVISHIPMLRTNYDNLEIFDFISILLEQNEFNAAMQIITIIKTEGDRTLYSNAAYYLSKYYFERRQWGKVISLLDSAINDLAAKEYHRALLMKGVAFQHQNKYHEAINVYIKVPPSSSEYIAAQLNMAIANIRQGWWTDGYSIITGVLAANAVKKQEETINRLYLTLGYTFLYKEYYRNSRDAFRQVGLNSQYTNRALLGLSLAAANQEDNIGALNAINILMRSKKNDLVVDEAHFLLPYLYEKIRQFTTASSGFTEAITYYDNRITHINSIIHANSDLFKYGLVVDRQGKIHIDGMTIDLSIKYPVSILSHYLKLESYNAIVEQLGSTKISQEYSNLHDKYAATIRKMTQQVLLERIKYLESYKDQSRYGLARLYDNNTATK